MLCLWQPTFNHMRRSLDGFTSRLAPIRAAVRAPAILSRRTPFLQTDYWELALRNIKGCRPTPRAILPFAQRVAKRFVKRGSTIVSDHYLRDCSKNGPRRQR